MAVSNWGTTVLAVYGDVTTRYARALSLTDQPDSDPTAQQTEVTGYIAKAKEYIGRNLDVVLRQRFATENWVATDDLKDNISNLDVLKNACVARTLYLLFENNTFNDTDYNYTMMEKYAKEFKDEFTIAENLLRFDLDADGDISQQELIQGFGSVHFNRV